MAWAPVLFLPAPLQGTLSGQPWGLTSDLRIPQFPFADIRFVPHYPELSPLDSILRLAEPGTDEYIAEGYAAQIASLLAAWSEELKIDPRGISVLRTCVAPLIQFTSLKPERKKQIRSGNGIEVLHREFPSGSVTGIDRFLGEITSYLAELKSVETADFEIYEFKATGSSPLLVNASIRYEIVGKKSDESRE